MRSRPWKRIDVVLDDIQRAVFYERKVRVWMNEGTQICMLAPDEDVIYVFLHILQHFFKEGVGFRQICDWCRLLWVFRNKFNIGLLERRLRAMGVMSEWKAFAYLAVNNLGMPIVAMPFYSPSNQWHRKADRILECVL